MNLFINNLSATTSEEDIKKLFSTFGKVDKVDLITQRDTGKSAMFAFVEMPNRNEARIAIRKLNSKLFFDKYIEVTEVRDNPHTN